MLFRSSVARRTAFDLSQRAADGALRPPGARASSGPTRRLRYDDDPFAMPQLDVSCSASRSTSQDTSALVRTIIPAAATYANRNKDDDCDAKQLGSQAGSYTKCPDTNLWLPPWAHPADTIAEFERDFARTVAENNIDIIDGRLRRNARKNGQPAPDEPITPWAPSAEENAQLLADARSVVVHDGSGEFVILGGNLTDAYDEFNKERLKRGTAYFDTLDKLVDIAHPQVLYTLARFSGYLRMRFFAMTTPPQHSDAVLQQWHARCMQFLEKLLGFKAPPEAVHTRYGLGVPDYHGNRVAMYNKANLVRNYNGHVLDRVMLSPFIPANLSGNWEVHLRAQATADWMTTQPRGRDTRMRHDEFKMAMAIRCRTIPSYWMTQVDTQNTTCKCGTVLKDVFAIIKHALNCSHTGFGPSKRHTDVKFAISGALLRHNFSVTREPTCYSHFYDGSAEQRPDLLVHCGARSFATDIVVCQQDGDVGENAKKQANIKYGTHLVAVANIAGHTFFPYALEAHGHRDISCLQFTRAVLSTRSVYEERTILRDINTCVSIALARARVNAVTAVLANASRSNPFLTDLQQVGSDNDNEDAFLAE